MKNQLRILLAGENYESSIRNQSAEQYFVYLLVHDCRETGQGGKWNITECHLEGVCGF